MNAYILYAFIFHIMPTVSRHNIYLIITHILMFSYVKTFKHAYKVNCVNAELQLEV